MRTEMVSRACSNCAGDYENPDLTAPVEGEGDVENVSVSSDENRDGRALQVTDKTGLRVTSNAHETLSDARGRAKDDLR